MKASGRVFGFLGLMLGVTAGALTGVAVKGLISDPVVTGGGAVAFYLAFSLSTLLTVFVMLNYLMMTLRISSDIFDVRLGMKSGVVTLTDIVAVRVAEPKSRMTRAAAQARPDMQSIAKMWSVLGVRSGIEVDIRLNDSDSDDKVNTWFIASNDPETLSEKLSAAITTSEADSTNSQP
ncbi:MAG: hypothetical protein HQ477_05625 [Chloroflexi bacterium]|nr:hypothetical protein [Chloroflexota bacterium]